MLMYDLRRYLRRVTPRFGRRPAPAIAPLPSPPLFVGGTGRSGTTVTARLLGARADSFTIPIEVRFLTDPYGLVDLARGRSSMWRFERKMLGRWFERTGGRGLRRVTQRSAVEEALMQLRESRRDDPWTASARFAHRLLDPLAITAGAERWIEMTPGNVAVAAALIRMFPGARVIHTVRDGRDVACSVAPLPWGPSDLDEALEWWAASLEEAFAACDDAPPGQVHVLQLEDLVGRNREREYARLASFVGGDDPAMRQYFDSRMAPDQAHMARWRRDVPPDRLSDFEAHHASLARALAERGRPYTPIGVDEPLGTG